MHEHLPLSRAIRHIVPILVFGALLTLSFSIYVLIPKIVSRPISDPRLVTLIMIIVSWITYLALIRTIAHAAEISAKRLSVIIMVLAAIIYCALAVQPPSQSQDLYWHLLVTKGSVVYHQDPYLTKPNELLSDPWAPSVLGWRNSQTTHGPLWVTLLSGIVALSPTSLIGAYSLVKLLFALVLCLCLLLWRSIIQPHVQKKDLPVLLGVMAFNPLLLQHVLIDGHSDILVMAGILVSYFCLQKMKFTSSIAALILAGSVKFIPWILLPIPIFVLWRSSASRWSKLRTTLFSIACGSLLFAVMYAPYGWTALNPPGLITEMTIRGETSSMLPGSLLLSALFHLSVTQLRIAGTLLFGVTMAYFLYRQKITHAYVIPILVLFFWGTSWFMSWYILWVLLLLPFLVSTRGFLLITLLVACSSFGITSMCFIALYGMISKAWLFERHLLFRRAWFQQEWSLFTSPPMVKIR